MRSRMWRAFAAIAALSGLLTCVAPGEADNAEHLKRAVESLQKAQLPSGLLRYDFDFLAGASSDEDNAVRQASAMAFLAEHLLESGDASIESTVRRALERFEALSLPLGKGRVQTLLEWTGVLSLPTGRHKLASILDGFGWLHQPAGDGAVLSLEKDYAQAWAGATALALLAELRYSEATGDARFEATRIRWLRGLAALYVRRLGFRASPTLIHTSPFADGQGWLALAYYEARRPRHPLVAAILTELEERLMRHFAKSFSIEFYQWGAMAAAVRWDSTRSAHFANFIETQTVSAVKWVREPRSTNSCATVEGLATAARVLRDAGRDTRLVSSIDRHVVAEMRRNYEFQILPKAGRLDLGNGVSIVSPKLNEFAGAFLHERYRPYTRIDFTRHCMTAMMRLQRLGARR